MNLFKGTWYDFASVKGFFGNTRFKHPSGTLEVCFRNLSGQSLQIVQLPIFQTLIPWMQPTKLMRQLWGCSPAAACYTSEKSLPLSKLIAIFMYNVSASCSFLLLLGSEGVKLGAKLTGKVSMEGRPTPVASDLNCGVHNVDVAEIGTKVQDEGTLSSCASPQQLP